jgi:hypothetical protein
MISTGSARLGYANKGLQYWSNAEPIHQQVHNLLAGFLPFLDLPQVGSLKKATKAYRRSIFN